MKKKVVMGSTLLISLALAGIVSANPASLPDLDQIRPDKVSAINADLEKIVARPGYIKVIDHNPTSYSKRELGGHTVESWIKNGVAYTAVDGVTTKESAINADLERVLARPGYIKVIDHNPTSYSKRELGGHTVESWIKDGVAYTVLD